jgi:hypothetical protein
MARGAGLVAGLLALTGCEPPDPDLTEIQLINAVSNDINRNLTLRVMTPRNIVERPFPYGDSTNDANWVKLQLPIFSGDAVTFGLVNSAGVSVMTDSCVVADPSQYGHVKALLSPLDLGGGRHVDCAEGFVDNTP